MVGAIISIVQRKWRYEIKNSILLVLVLVSSQFCVSVALEDGNYEKPALRSSIFDLWTSVDWMLITFKLDILIYVLKLESHTHTLERQTQA